MKEFMGLGVAAAIVAVAVLAASAAAAAPGVEIRRAVARVTVIPEARADVAVSVTRTNSKFPLRISRVGDQVIIEGPLDWRSANCHTIMGHPRVTVWGMGEAAWEDMPQVIVRTPRTARVGASGAVFGVIGSGDSVELGNSGCGDWTVADQTGLLRVRLTGSGDVHAGSAASADLEVSGSADVTLRAARAGLNVAIGGSGDVSADTVNGPLHARIGGSGDVHVRGGQVTDMDVAVGGSGDVRFGGVARSLTARVGGSGDVSVARVTGSVTKQVSGSGDVSVGR